MRHLILLFIFFLALTVSPTAGQNSQDDLRLAYSYYNSREYDKAEYLFEKLYNQSKSQNYYNYYINCLVNTLQYEKAEKSIKKQLSSSVNESLMRVLLGHIYKLENKLDKANTEFKQAIEKLRPERNNIIQVANQFLNIDEREYAEKAILKGQEITKQDFSMDLFQIYAGGRDFKKMADIGIEIVNTNPSEIYNVQNYMRYYINNDINDEFYEILRTALLQQNQKTPSTSNTEMMIWLYTQKQNYKAAIIQAKALDKRLNGNGERLINIADQALAAQDYTSATDAYKYIISKGSSCQYYMRASFGVLKSMYEQVKNRSITDNEQIIYLENQYIKTFEEMGINSKTINEIKNFANLETYILNKPDSAKSIIEKALAVAGINYQQKAQLNLELGDIMLYKGDEWDALMIYAKVENDNKQNEYGDEAKFRKAKIAYYTGNFKWAASQLDVLKAATTKFVANDAMELSLLISDNAERENNILGDTTSSIVENINSNKELRIYARADKYFYQNRDNKAVESLDSIIEFYKTSTLVDEAFFLKGKIAQRNHQYEQAANYFKKVADEYSYDILADKACYHYAILAETKLGNSDSAKEYYMKILSDYPGSVFAVEARERYRKLSNN